MRRKVIALLFCFVTFVCVLGVLYLLFETNAERKIVIFFSCLAMASGLVRQIIIRKGEEKNEQSDDDA